MPVPSELNCTCTLPVFLPALAVPPSNTESVEMLELPGRIALTEPAAMRASPATFSSRADRSSLKESLAATLVTPTGAATNASPTRVAATDTEVPLVTEPLARRNTLPASRRI